MPSFSRDFGSVIRLELLSSCSPKQGCGDTRRQTLAVGHADDRNARSLFERREV